MAGFPGGARSCGVTVFAVIGLLAAACGTAPEHGASAGQPASRDGGYQPEPDPGRALGRHQVDHRADPESRLSILEAPMPARDTAAVVAGIERRLREAGNPARAAAERAYLKSGMEFAGATVPDTRRIVRALLPRRPTLPRDDLLAVVAGLWARPPFECRHAAVMLLTEHVEALAPADAALVERLIRESGTWALVDVLAAAVMGRLAERYPELTAVLDRWAADGDFWVRRAALLALLGPLRRGDGDFARFGRYADMMLTEREFFVRKAIGWVLRDTGRRRPDLVAAWLEPRIGRVSGVTLREAVKPLPPEAAARLLAAYRTRPRASAHDLPRS
jgi:3-methyladenine DNA glycosylase AlkD